jgi:hypothetical protein
MHLPRGRRNTPAQIDKIKNLETIEVGQHEALLNQ